MKYIYDVAQKFVEFAHKKYCLFQLLASIIFFRNNPLEHGCNSISTRFFHNLIINNNFHAFLKFFKYECFKHLRLFLDLLNSSKSYQNSLCFGILA